MRWPNSGGGGRRRRGELAEKDQGTRGNLVGGDVMVGVDRRGWNGGDPRRRRWSSMMAAMFRHAGDWRGVGMWSRSCTGVMWFGWYACREWRTVGAVEKNCDGERR
jgi:hypothetical protein